MARSVLGAASAAGQPNPPVNEQQNICRCSTNCIPHNLKPLRRLIYNGAMLAAREKKRRGPCLGMAGRRPENRGQSCRRVPLRPCVSAPDDVV